MIDLFGDFFSTVGDDYIEMTDGCVITIDNKAYKVTVEELGTLPEPKDTRSLDNLLGFSCTRCLGTFAGKEQCKNTGKCKSCSDNYEPVTLKDA